MKLEIIAPGGIPGFLIEPREHTRMRERGVLSEEAVAFDHEAPKREAPNQQGHKSPEEEATGPFLNYNNHAESQAEKPKSAGLDVVV
jgi:hypothetical protein